jgi:hypothetical protein
VCQCWTILIGSREGVPNWLYEAAKWRHFRPPGLPYPQGKVVPSIVAALRGSTARKALSRVGPCAPEANRCRVVAVHNQAERTLHPLSPCPTQRALASTKENTAVGAFSSSTAAAVNGSRERGPGAQEGADNARPTGAARALSHSAAVLVWYR